MNNTIIFLSLFILFLSLMLTIKIKLSVDLNNNKIILVVWFFQIKIITISISVIGLYYQINNSKKLKPISLIIKDEDKYLLGQIKSSIIDKLYYDDIILQSDIGLSNAANTAISIGCLNFICSMLADYLSIHNPDTKLYFSNTANFSQIIFYFDLELKVHFTIFDLLFAVIMSFYKRGKYVKERKQKG